METLWKMYEEAMNKPQAFRTEADDFILMVLPLISLLLITAIVSLCVFGFSKIWKHIQERIEKERKKQFETRQEKGDEQS